MAETYHVPATQSPTFWNRDIGVGLALSIPVALAAVNFLPLGGTSVLADVALGLAIEAPFAVAGGLLGKRRMERESQEGKDVSEPSFFNKFALAGAYMASFTVSAALLLMGQFAEPLMYSSSIMSNVIETFFMTESMLPHAAVYAGALAVGSIAGGVVGKSIDGKEYEAAKAYDEAQKAILPEGRSVEQAYSVTPDLAAELFNKLEAVKSRPKAPVIAAQPDASVIRA